MSTITEGQAGQFPVPQQATAVATAAQEFVERMDLARAIVTEVDAMRATNALAEIGAMRKRSEATKKAVVGPLQDHVKFLNGEFKKAIEPLDQAEGIIKRGLLDYHQQQEQAAAEARRQAEAQAAAARQAAEAERQRAEVAARLAGQEAPAPAPVSVEVALPEVVHVPTVHTAAGSTSVQKRWTYELEDIRALCAAVAAGEVSPEFVELAKGPTRKAVNAGVRDLPGVRIYQEAGIMARGA